MSNEWKRAVQLKGLLWMAAGGIAGFFGGWLLMYFPPLWPLLELPVRILRPLWFGIIGAWYDWLLATLVMSASFFFAGFLLVGVMLVRRRSKAL